jgi:hypothetical protein
MKTMMDRRKYLLGLGTALLGTACVSTRLEPGTDHPANAHAEPAPPPQRDNILASAPTTPAAQPTSGDSAPRSHEHSTPMADIYTCPMHPQIVRNTPGKCPVCGMNLVKKENAAPREAAH